MDKNSQGGSPLNLADVIGRQLVSGIEKGVYSGAAAGVVLGGEAIRPSLIQTIGKSSFGAAAKPITRATCFDLASLTKPLATGLAILCLLKEGAVDLQTPLADLLGERVVKEKESITLRMLLNHSSGLAAHREFFKVLPEEDPAAARSGMLEMILTEPLASEPGRRIVYSDLGFILLGWAVERLTGQGLDDFLRQRILEPLGLGEQIFFVRGGEAKRGREFACCETCGWRGRTLCGEVSDENAFCLGGVAGHAGLFGHIEAVTVLVGKLLAQWQGREAPQAYEREDLIRFLTRQQEAEKGTWGLGFDTPAAEKSSGGRFISPTSAGHLGFTGTSFWIDPVRDAAVVLLTNRVHPSRDNDKIKMFRPAFHDAVFAALDGLGG